MIKNPPANAGDARDRGLIPGSGRSHREGNGNPLQYSCLESHGLNSPWGCKESDTTEQLSFHLCLSVVVFFFTVLGLSCSTQDLSSALWHAGSSAAARELLLVARGI